MISTKRNHPKRLQLGVKICRSCKSLPRKNNFDARIDHRSYADRGIDLEATLHEGSAVTAMKRKYEREQLKPIEERNLKIIMPTIALENDAIKARNAEN